MPAMKNLKMIWGFSKLSEDNLTNSGHDCEYIPENSQKTLKEGLFYFILMKTKNMHSITVSNYNFMKTKK